VKVGGFLVNPSDVEQVLLSFPDVAEALCWAEPHPLLGFALAAEVVPEPGADLDAKTLQRLCLTRLERHQMPRTVSIVDRLPDTPGGKRRLSPMSRHVAG
jgi:acyl-coenzyme A synthetase/AMP-(fatty) acid ligase